MVRPPAVLLRALASNLGMTNTSERRVHQQDDPDLYEHLQSLMFSGATEVELEGVTYNVARDTDEAGGEFVLTPVAES